MIAPRFFDMFMIKQILQRDYNGVSGIKTKNGDRVSVITGYEGKGKSTLLMHMFDYWYNTVINKPLTSKHIKYLASNQKEFVDALKESSNKNKRYYMIAHDEAGKDMYARNAIGAFNKDMNVAYQVIRGLNLYTLLVIPNLLDLDSFFRKRRVTDMYHVYDWGKVAYYSKNKLRELIPALIRMSQNNSDPNPLYARNLNGQLIRPDFIDTFPMYKNDILLKPYLERKKGNMLQTVNSLFDKYNVTKVTKNDVSRTQRSEYVKLYNKGLNNKEVAEKMGVNVRTIYRMKAEAKQMGEIT